MFPLGSQRWILEMVNSSLSTRYEHDNSNHRQKALKAVKLEVNSQWFVTKCHLKIFKTFKIKHDDNASSHITKLMVYFLKDKGLKYCKIHRIRRLCVTSRLKKYLRDRRFCTEK